jgi:hypothetical protein
MARLQLGVDVTVEGARELQKVSDGLAQTGDELDDLAALLDGAADAARRAAADVNTAADGINFDRASDSAQRFEDTGEGVRNTVNGLTDVFSAATDESASWTERLALGAGGIADVASGMRNAVLPALQAVAQGGIASAASMVASAGRQVAAWALLGAQSLLHAGKVALAWVIAAGPVGALVAAIVAAVGLIILNWDKVVAFFQTAFRIIREALANFGDFFRKTWDRLMDFLGGIGKAIIGIGKTLWEPVGKGFAAAIDFVKGIWNAFARWWNGINIAVPSIDIPFIGKVGGFSIGLPDLPMLADGGIVTGPTLALIGEKGPEAVVPLDRDFGSTQPIIGQISVVTQEPVTEQEIASVISRVLWTQGLTDRVLTNG